MSKGKRYEGTPKLNMKKVIGTIVVFATIVLLIVLGVRYVKNRDKKVETKNIATVYKTVYTNGKWGVIDSKAETVIKPTYDDMIIIPDETKPLFVCQQNVNIETENYKSFVINEKEERLFTDYDNVESIQNINDQGKLFFFENTLKVSKDNKIGLINFNGKELLEPVYESIEPIKYLKNSLVTTKDGKKGLVDNSGNVIIENKYEDIEALTDKYENGYIVKENGKYGLINYNKKQILDCKYDEIEHVAGNDLYAVKEGNNNIKIITSSEEVLIDNKFDEIYSIDNEFLTVKQSGKYGVMTKNGEIKIQPEYDTLEYLFEGKYVAEKDEKFGIIESNENIVLEFNYTNINYMNEEGFIEADKENGKTEIMNSKFEVKCEGIVSEINSKYNYLKIRENGEYKYYNFKLEEKTTQEIFPANTLYLSKQNGKYGFVNKNGIVTVNYIFDDATEQNDYGYAAVKKDGKWGTIDSKGELVTENKYELANNPIISFIGKWHLAPDLNANYYTDVDE